VEAAPGVDPAADPGVAVRRAEPEEGVAIGSRMQLPQP
jgi:hypothetical protein